MSWDEMHENVEDRQSSGGKLRKAIRSPFHLICMDIKNDYGAIIGELVIEELIKLNPSDPWVCRSALWWAPEQKPKTLKTLPKHDGFPDEDDGA